MKYNDKKLGLFFFFSVAVVACIVIFLELPVGAGKITLSDKTKTEIMVEIHSISGSISTEDEIKIGEKTYTREQLLWDFTNVAINRHLWLDDASNPKEILSRRKNTVGDHEKYKNTRSTHPVIAEYLYRPNGLPRSHTINKWAGEITIGIDWQRIKAPLHDGSMKEISGVGFNPWGQNVPEVYPLFKEHILSLVSDIQMLTGLPVTFIEHDDPREIIDVNASDKSSKTHARIRIVPTRMIGSRTYIPDHGPHTFEPYFLGGVAFTPFETDQVDGYTLPNVDNTIGFAACRISPDLDKNIVRAFITECLVRALGLPELSKTDDSSATVRHWNQKVIRKVTQVSDDHNIATVVSASELEKGFSDYDKFMIGLLYCSAIKPGMDTNKIIEVLEEDQTCWENAKRKIGK